jgi:transposase
MPKFKDYSVGQAQLLPPSLEDNISSDHIARLINEVVEKMDLSFIENLYSADGCPAYHPKMLVKILVYGYTVGIRSSRKLADRLSEDLVFMWLAGRQTPDFRTISDFRKDKLSDVKKIFVEVLGLCRQMGMVRVGKVSIDGTKFRGDANGNRMQYRKTLEKRKESIEERVDDIFAEAEEIDEEEEKLYGDSTEHTGAKWTKEDLEKALKRMKKKKESLGKKKDKLEAKKADIDLTLRKMRKDRNSMSSTDKDATMMLMKEGYIAPGHNAQFVSEHQVILGYGLTSDRNDYRQLKPMVEEVKSNTGRKPETVLADAGYGRKMNYRYLKNERVTAFIPYGQFNREMAERNKGIYAPTKDRELARYKFIQQMRLKSAEGEKMMERRREDIEPVIGDIKRNMNFRTFNLRGKPKCLIELGLVSIGHNLKKMKSYLKRAVKRDNGNQAAEKLGMILGYQPA